ncbi:hypothetical protein ACWCXX_09300 [Streptomyces sp. NPDC001732]
MEGRLDLVFALAGRKDVPLDIHLSDGDMLARAHLLAYRTDARTDAELAACYEAVARGGAALLGLPASRLEPGDPADFVLVAAGSLPEAVVDRPIPSLVVRAGRIVARGGELV